jgi:hypothetical protein
MKKQKNGSGRHFSKNRKIPKEPHFKPNIKNLFYKILVNIPKILHVKNEEDPVENKKIARSDVLAKLGERKDGQVQATPKTSRCALCSYISYGQNKKGQKCTKTVYVTFLRHRLRVKNVLLLQIRF